MLGGVFMQLLKITTTPIKIKVVSEKASFEEEKAPSVPDLDSLKTVQRTTAGEKPLNEQNKNTLDAQYSDYQTKKANYSNYRKDKPISKSESGSDSGVYDIKFRYGQKNVVPGNEHIRVSGNGVGRVNNASIESNVQKLKKAVPDDSWEPDNKQTKKFVPGKITFEIEEMADIDIEYVGGFNYFPKSSDPEYEEPEEQKET